MTRLRIHRRLSFSTVVALLALFVALGTGTAYAAYVISSNSQIGPNTIAGHHTPTGDHGNIIAGTINGADIQSGSIGSGQLTPPESWHPIVAGPTGTDDCSLNPPATGVFCGSNNSTFGYWGNSGGSFTPAAFYLDPQRRVHLRGLVSFTDKFEGFTDASQAVFILPRSYRPAHELVFTTLDNDSGGSYLVRVDVTPSGYVAVVNDDMVKSNPNSSGGTFLSLDNISFRVGE